MDDMTKPVNDKTAIALIGKDIGYIQKDIGEIKQNIQTLTGVFASKEELKQVAQETEKRLCSLEEKRNYWRFLSPVLSAVLASTVTFLLIEYIKGGGST